MWLIGHGLVLWVRNDFIVLLVPDLSMSVSTDVSGISSKKRLVQRTLRIRPKIDSFSGSSSPPTNQGV